MHTQFVRRLNEQSDTFVFRDRLVHIAHFAYEIRKRDCAKTCRSLTFLDFRKAQNGGDDRKRLIDCLYRFVCNHLQLLKRLGAGATALKRQPRTREWRAQVMRYVIADACQRVDERFHLVEHAVDYHRKFGEGIVGLPMRESFPRLPATMRCTRSLTPTIRLRVRALSATPTARQRSTAGTRPSATAEPTTLAISSISSTLRPIISTSPFGKLRAIKRTACFSRPLSSTLSTTALCTALSISRSGGRLSRLPAIRRPPGPNNPAIRIRRGSCFRRSPIASSLRSDGKAAKTSICAVIIRSDRTVRSPCVFK